MDIPPGFSLLSDFLAEQHAKGIAREGWLRWNFRRLRARIWIKWWRFQNGNKPLRVSQEAFDIVSANHPTPPIGSEHP